MYNNDLQLGKYLEKNENKYNLNLIFLIFYTKIHYIHSN